MCVLYQGPGNKVSVWVVNEWAWLGSLICTEQHLLFSFGTVEAILMDISETRGPIQVTCDSKL